MAAQDVSPTSEGTEGTDVKESGSVSVEHNDLASTPPPPPTISAPQISTEPGDVQQAVQAPEEPVPESAATTVAPPPPKRSFPKILVILFALLIILILGFVLVRFIFNRQAPGESGDLTWWGLWEEEAVVAPLIEEYQTLNPNVRITYVKQSPQDYRERLTNALASGKGPDIFRFHNSWVPMFKNDLDTLPSSVMSPAEFAQTFYPIASSDLSSGANIVGLPLEYDGLALYINEEIFESSGKTTPKTWNDLRKTAIELTIRDEEGLIRQAGVALGRTENVDHWPEILGLMMLQNRVNMAKPEGELAEDALSFFTIFSSVDSSWDETLPPSTVAFATGKLAMYIGPSWRAFEIRERNPNLRFKTVAVPQLPKATPDEADITYATYWAEGVWARSKSKNAAWEFLKFLTTKDSLEKLYQLAAKIRYFGEPYPRVDMADLLVDHPILGAIVAQGSSAQSWYLASRTFDGATGINSQLSSYFGDAINAVNNGIRPDKALETAALGVTQVLSQYGLNKR